MHLKRFPLKSYQQMGILDKESEIKDNNADFSGCYALVDIGVNLADEKFSSDVNLVVQRAKEAGVKKIIITGTSVSASKEASIIAHLFPGVHPYNAETFDETSVSEIESLCKNGQCVAVGECGLDFNKNFAHPDNQLEVFEKQVEMACTLQKPLFLHERDAHCEMIKVLKKYEDRLPQSVVHCFTGTVSQVQSYLNMGLYIGLTGNVWKDKSEDGVRKILSDNIIPPNRLLVETDAPFMCPITRSPKLKAPLKEVISPRSLNYLKRHCTLQRNEPCSLPATVEMISHVMNKTPEEVALATTYNARKLFNLSS